MLSQSVHQTIWKFKGVHTLCTPYSRILMTPPRAAPWVFHGKASWQPVRWMSFQSGMRELESEWTVLCWESMCPSFRYRCAHNGILASSE